MFSPVVFVNGRPKKIRVDFHEIWGIGTVRTGEGLFKIWKVGELGSWLAHLLHTGSDTVAEVYALPSAV